MSEIAMDFYRNGLKPAEWHELFELLNRCNKHQRTFVQRSVKQW